MRILGRLGRSGGDHRLRCGGRDRTDFIMSPRAFSKLGRYPQASAELVKYGVVDIEYTKVPCRYAGYNIRIKIHESSRYPYYLAIVILYVPGQNDVTGVEIYENDRSERMDADEKSVYKWGGVRHRWGATWTNYAEASIEWEKGLGTPHQEFYSKRLETGASYGPQVVLN